MAEIDASPAKRQRVGASTLASIVMGIICLNTPHASGSAVEVSLALDSKCILGESPVWDAKLKRLHFVDINGMKLHSFDPKSSKCCTVEMDEEVGCVVPYKKQRVLVAGVSAIMQVDFKGKDDKKPDELGEGKLSPVLIASVPASECETVDNQGEDPMIQPIPGFRFNDGKCDPKGRFLVGTMNKDWRDAAARKGRLFSLVEPPELINEDDLDGMLHQYGPNAVLKPIIDDVQLSNGMAWGRSMGKGPDEPFDIFYFIDSALQTVDSFEYDEASGRINISSRKTVVKVPTLSDGGGVPDGMTIDSDGMLWVALGESGSVARYDPATGKELMRVQLPVQRPTACTFGGDELEDLYVTTREEKGDNPSKNWGGLFRVKIPGVKGLDPAYHYGNP